MAHSYLPSLLYTLLGIHAGLIAGTALTAVCTVIQAFLFVRGIVALAVPRKADDLPAAPVYR